MDIFYAKKKRIELQKSGSVELYIDINYFNKQLDVVVSDVSGEERFLSSNFGSAISRYKELCFRHRKGDKHINV